MKFTVCFKLSELPTLMNKSFSSSINSSDDHVPTDDSYVKFDQQIFPTRDEFELLKIISNAYDKSISEYIQKAVIETMKTEIG